MENKDVPNSYFKLRSSSVSKKILITDQFLWNLDFIQIGEIETHLQLELEFWRC